MRIAKRIFAALAVVFALLAAVMTVLPHLLLSRAKAASVGIIGGADGPTAIFVASSWPSPITSAIILAVLCGVTALVMHLSGKKHDS